MDEKQFEQDYRNWKRQAAPDLWERIEGRLKDYPEREESATTHPLQEPKLHPDKIRINAKKRMYALAAGCAAVIYSWFIL